LGLEIACRKFLNLVPLHVPSSKSPYGCRALFPLVSVRAATFLTGVIVRSAALAAVAAVLPLGSSVILFGGGGTE
jgi:hypothetical protein